MFRYQGIGLKGPVGEWVRAHCCCEGSDGGAIEADDNSAKTRNRREYCKLKKVRCEAIHYRSMFHSATLYFVALLRG